MNKIASYKEQIYKEAGVLLGATGGIVGGGLLGSVVGTGAANVRNTLTFDKERRQLAKDVKTSHNVASKAHKNYVNKLIKAEDDMADSFDKYLKSLPKEKANNLTMKDIEDYAERYDAMQKKASVTGKTALITGLPAAIATTRLAYKDGTNKATMRDIVKRNNNNIAKYNKKVTTKDVDKARVFKIDNGYLHGDESKSTMNEIDRQLKAKGIDRNKVKYNDYKGIYQNVMEYDPYDDANTDGDAIRHAVNKYVNKK